MNTSTKVIAVFLACLLILVGISNLLSDNDQEQHVAKVGKEVISLNEYKSLYQSYSNATSSSETQKKLKYDLLNALIEQKLLLNLTNELDLEVGEESIKDHIKNTKYFQNDTGEFDKNKFNEMLNSLHITEEEYVLKLKRILPAIMFMTSLFKDSYPITYGEEIDEQIYKHRYQTRVVDIIKITKDAVTSISEPDNQTLLNFYEKNKSNFYYPEYRTAQYISIGPKYFEDQVKISAEEVDNVIEQRALKDQRDVLNLVFSTKEKAEKAKKMLIEDKRNFEQVALEFGKTGFADIRINNITKDFLPQNMQDIIFALKEGEISDILESSFGWHIIKIESVHQIS
ncbi:Peptidyl-prolyl cis-trans isomerase, PpiC-type,Trigger factor/SurA domain [Cinara cedri]|uniref:Periplasmic chaperone PpiD n=1 Tax=Cinara cedri TaxID=506608 RepID=A0A5E4N038_9HEMI|nr:Peptidyl-prolyl cis-trans isomerase, PpiC-type,Trigger factor/SurA domain [Cinara cedri]